MIIDHTHISSKKIESELNFKPKFTIDDAINDLKECICKWFIAKFFNRQ